MRFVLSPPVILLGLSCVLTSFEHVSASGVRGVTDDLRGLKEHKIIGGGKKDSSPKSHGKSGKKGGKKGNGKKGSEKRGKRKLPNFVVFMVDDLGYNQVGYHANNRENDEIVTPSIDDYADAGIKMDRGYMTPWCGPSRAAFQTGRLNAYNANISNNVYNFYKFDDDIGFVGGLQPGTNTIATALKEHGNYATSYVGKWGIGGTSWSNTPLGMGYDEFIGYWGDSLESCDGRNAWQAEPPFICQAGEPCGPAIATALPGYWRQSQYLDTAPLCDFYQANSEMTQDEKDVACRTTPRTLPKLIDQDIMEESILRIRQHDYESQPLFHMHAAQLMHTPTQYPQDYDQKFLDVDLPPYFASGATKQNATNDDLRLATRNAMNFVDDVFGNVMQAIKDAGQWKNTVVLFTSDNGGSIYQGTANNNYPLRGAKFSSFEGGLRVPQFLSGGWIEDRIGKKGGQMSDTYVFTNDWAPTFLEMAGARNSKHLFTQDDPPYGNRMWKYIKNSISYDEGKKKSQLARTVSYSPWLYVDVGQEVTKKYYWTGDTPTYVPRLWNSVWPTNNDTIPDLGYLSYHPCRANGEEDLNQCCVFDIESDQQEKIPLPFDCDELLNTGSQNYYVAEVCDETPGLCVDSNLTEPTLGNVTNDVFFDNLTLWTNYGATGPFSNTNGDPIGQGELPVKCVCETIEPGVDQNKVGAFIPAVFSPSHCTREPSDYRGAVPCSGGFQRLPELFSLQDYADQGVDPDAYDIVVQAEREQLVGFVLPEVYQTLSSFLFRENYIEWPKYEKFPYITTGQDSCTDKGVTTVPFPVLTFSTWVLGAKDPTVPTSGSDELGMCQRYDVTKYFCPSKDNPYQKLITSWDYDKEDPHGTFEDGTRLEYLSVVPDPDDPRPLCARACKLDESGSAFIGDGEAWGLDVTYSA